MFELPFQYRIAILIGVLVVVAFAELAFAGKSATRWLEYSILLGVACVAAIVGALNDSITVRLSPDYFAVGKGLGYRSDLTVQAAILGAEAGFTAGIIVGGVLLFAGTAGHSHRRYDFRKLAGPVACPLILAIVFGVLLGFVFRFLSGCGFMPKVEGLSGSESVSFMTVWGVHIGLYLGAATGLIAGVLMILSRRGMNLRLPIRERGG